LKMRATLSPGLRALVLTAHCGAEALKGVADFSAAFAALLRRRRSWIYRRALASMIHMEREEGARRRQRAATLARASLAQTQARTWRLYAAAAAAGHPTHAQFQAAKRNAPKSAKRGAKPAAKRKPAKARR